mgnify:FL=1
MDRMPKEYKCAIYILFIGLVYFVFFAVTLFIRFKIIESSLSNSIAVICAAIFLIYAMPTIFLFLKKEFARKLLLVIVPVNIVLNIALACCFYFFKDFATFVSNTFNLGAFTPYLILGVARVTPDKALFIIILATIWLFYLVYLLNHKETKTYIKTKTYQEVNTQLFTIINIVLLFVTIGAISFLFSL